VLRAGDRDSRARPVTWTNARTDESARDLSCRRVTRTEMVHSLRARSHGPAGARHRHQERLFPTGTRDEKDTWNFQPDPSRRCYLDDVLGQCPGDGDGERVLRVD